MANLEDNDQQPDRGIRSWFWRHAPWIASPDGFNWIPTSLVSLGVIAVVAVVVGVLISL